MTTPLRDKTLRERLLGETDKKCTEHLSYADESCPDCGMDVDCYGNTESSFDYCCFPDCGCDGSRLCMAPSGASERAFGQNVEGMWSGKTKAQRRAVFALLGSLAKEPGPAAPSPAIPEESK